MPSVRTLHARGEWNVRWLWDAGSLLVLLNGGIVIQAIAEHRTLGIWSIPLFLAGAAVTFGVFLVADALFHRGIPSTDTGSNTFHVLIPAVVVCVCFAAAFGASTAIAVDSTADQFLLLGIANVAATFAVVAVFRYSS